MILDTHYRQIFQLNDSAARETYLAGCYGASTLYEYHLNKLLHGNRIHRRYINALEKQLEPEVIEEIKAQLSVFEEEKIK
jgi:hypothetical protein